MVSDSHTAQEPSNYTPEGPEQEQANSGDPSATSKPDSDKPAVAKESAGATPEPPRNGEPENPHAVNEPTPTDLESQLLAAEQQLEEQKSTVLRLQAEMENLRKRSSREVENAHKYGLDRFVTELLPVKDSMELGVAAAHGEDVDIASIREGMALTLKMFGSAIEKFGVEEIAPAQGDVFDHERHQAISVQESPERESGLVLTVVQKGCLLNGRLVRPAMVIVSK